MEYKHRIADQMLAKKLASKGAVLIEGPKWCGKRPPQSNKPAVSCIWTILPRWRRICRWQKSTLLSCWMVKLQG